MYSFLQETFHRPGPLLHLVKLVEITAFAKKMMRQAHPVIETGECEVCAVTVGYGSLAFE